MARRSDPDVQDAEIIAGAMVRLGQGVLDEHNSPEWLVDVAYDAGLSLRQVAAMWDRVRVLEAPDLRDDVVAWAGYVVDVLAAVPYTVLSEMLSVKVFEGTKMRSLADPDATSQHHVDWTVLGELMRGWLVGVSLTELAEIAVKNGARGKGGRGSGNPLPKIIGLTEQLMSFSLPRISGAVAHLVRTAADKAPDLGWTLSVQTSRALDLLPIAVRAGCGDEASLAWWRLGGLRQRRFAHLAARLLPPPENLLPDDDAMGRWMQNARDRLLDPDFFMPDDRNLADDERQALIAATLLAGA